MTPTKAACIWSSIVSGAVALLVVLDAIEKLQRGYRLNSESLFEFVGGVSFYFVSTFIIVYNFPKVPTKCLAAMQVALRLKNLASPFQRVLFLVLCCGASIVLVTTICYYAAGYSNFANFIFGSQSRPSGWYRLWFWIGVAGCGLGLVGSYMYDLLLKPLTNWVQSGSTRNR